MGGTRLTVRSPARGTGWAEDWSFTGKDERTLRGLLGTLTAFRVPTPDERWDPATKKVVYGGDRWLAAMLVIRTEDISMTPSRGYLPTYEAAWSVAGARALAELMPEEFSDVSGAILRRFDREDGVS